jgi:hypothetical protein
MTQPPQIDPAELETLLAQANPVAVDDLPDPRSPAAEALYVRLRARVADSRVEDDAHPRRRRRLLAAALAASLLLVGGAALAAVTVGPWWQDAPAPVNPSVVDRQLTPPKDASFPPTADRSRARTVAQADGAGLVAAPVGESGYCLIPSLPGSPDLGFSCTYQVTNPEAGTSDEFRSYARPPSQGTPRWIVYGRITHPRAAALDLGAFTVPLRPGGFFLANVPEDRWKALANTASEGKIVDASGATLRTGCVNWTPSPADPAAGLSRFAFWSEEHGPCRARPVPTRPTPDLSKAQKLVETTLREKFSIWEKGTAIALWRAPTLEGGECVFLAPATLTPDDVSAAKSDRSMPGGGACTGPPSSPPRNPEPFMTGMSWTSLHDGTYSVLLQGQVAPRVAIARVTLRTKTGESTVPFENGYYLTQLENSNASGELPPGGPYVLFGYDSAGTVVATQDLQQLMAKHRPKGG